MLSVQFVSNDGKEMSYGVGHMPHMPRVGEYIWIQNKHESGLPRLQAVVVREVAYWVPNIASGYSGKVPCMGGIAYVEPVIKEEK